MYSLYGGNVKRWEPNMLVQDDVDEAYQPTDKAGKQLATSLTVYLNLLMWRVRIASLRREPEPRWANDPSYTPNCRCIVRPIKPD